MSFFRRVAFVVALAALPLFAQAPIPESEIGEQAFPQLQLPAAIFTLGDDEFALVGLRIESGQASMQERRWFYRAAERYAPFTTTPPADWKIKAFNASKKLPVGTVYNWTSIGPNGDYDVTRQWGPAGARTQGRATAIWTHFDGARAVNKNVIFLGTADGGLWKTTDGGQTWKPLTDFQPTLSTGSVDVLPAADLVNYSDATIYLATGEGNFSISDKDGVGVLKSTDGGTTWTVQPIKFQTDVIGAGRHRIRRIRIDKAVPNAQSVWVAGDGGVYHTSNGGTTWSLVTSLPYSAAPATAAYAGGCWNEFATDFAIVPNGTQSVLFAAFGGYRNDACATPTTDSRKNNGVYRSIDGGATWQKITVSLQNGFNTAIPGDAGRMVIQLAPSNPRHMYLQIAHADTTTIACLRGRRHVFI